MKQQVTYIAESVEEIEEILNSAKRAKAGGECFPFKVEGFMPADRVDEIIRACHTALGSGLSMASITFGP